MEKMQSQVEPTQQEVRQPQRKQFHGFSMGFLLILLAVVIGVYIICTIVAADAV